DLGADQAVIDPPAGGRLHESGSVAEDEHAITIGTLDRREGQNFLPRRTALGHLHAPSRSDRAEQTPEMTVRIAVAHDAHANAHPGGALDRDGPREATRREVSAEMHFHGAEP